MLIALYFTCQSVNSIVTIKPHLGYIVLLSIPSNKLFVNEISSCYSYQNLTSLYTVRIGENTFRSKFILYDWTKEIQIQLLPEDRSSIENAAQYTIASILITFLENNLVQQGSIGQLLVTIFNYNQCLEAKQILFETHKYLEPIILLNVGCKVIPTGDVWYSLNYLNENLQQKSIQQSDFVFSSEIFERFDCMDGTIEEQDKCDKWSQIVSRANFLTLNWVMTIPKKISTQNIFYDDYGVYTKEFITYDFNFTFIKSITQRQSIENCTGTNQVSFYNDTIFIEQTPINIQHCPTYSDHDIKYWLRVSELEDNSGQKFQLQFYNKVMYRINQWIDCDSWEISGYSNYQQCYKMLQNVHEFSRNMSLQISTIIYKDDIYIGAVHVAPKLINAGAAAIEISGSEICVQISNEIEYDRQFIGLTLRISYNSREFSEKMYRYDQTTYFEFPSKDKVYCFTGSTAEVAIFNSFVFVSYFGTVQAMQNIFSIGKIDAYIPYDIFWEGGVFLIGCIIICILWVVSRSKTCRRKK